MPIPTSEEIFVIELGQQGYQKICLFAKIPKMQTYLSEKMHLEKII
jgi:hypothetical protein